MSVVQQLAAFTAPWADLYSHHTAVQTAVAFGHFGGLLAAGGFALAADRSTLRAFQADVLERRRHLKELHATHRLVVPALVLTVFTGALMFAADLENLAVSPIFWAKIGLVGLLLANGTAMINAERSVRLAGGVTERAWKRLRRTAIASIALWFAAVLAGTALQAAG
jgi:hypothetical protein